MPEYMTPTEVAALLRVDIRTLSTWRSRKQGPPYVRLERSVRYEREQIIAWLERDAARQQAVTA